MDIRRDELPQVLPVFTCFYLVIETVQMLRTLLRSEFLGFYDDTPFSLLWIELTAAQAASIARL